MPKGVKSVIIAYDDGSQLELSNFFLVGALEGENKTEVVPLLGYDCTIGTLYLMLDKAKVFLFESMSTVPKQ